MIELYVASIAEGSVAKADGPMAPKGDVVDFVISPDSSRVVYRADEDKNGRFELFSHAIGGSGSVKLSGPLVKGGDMEGRAVFTADSRGVVYRADDVVHNQFELLSVDVGLRCGGELVTHVGSSGAAVLRGGSGADTLFGGGSDDRVFSDGGRDVINGNAGSDALDGGGDSDRCRGV